MNGQFAASVWLAWRDWKHEFFLSLCAVLALVSMLSPILVLLGLKNGVIEGMRVRLLEDPSVLIITPKSDAGRFSHEFINSLAQMPGARFAIGRTRATATDMTIVNPENGKMSSIALEPSAPGEPVLEKAGIAAPDNGPEPQIVLSAASAKALGAKAGTMLSASLGRRTPAGKLESTPLKLHVSAILPEEAADRKMAFAPLKLLEDMENYRDYLEVPERGYMGDPNASAREYSSFRLYAKNLEAVEPLVDSLARLHVETTARSRDIAAIRQLEKAINDIILIISMAIGAGFVAFTISSVQGSVLRKKKQLALLRLFGLERMPLIAYPLAQIFLTMISGFVVSLGVYYCVGAMIAHVFKDHGNLSCQLTLENLLLICCVVFVLSGLSCAWAAWQGASIEPSTVIREN